MTASQGNIYAHNLANLLTIVVGPPGSGKTYFLSVTAVRLLITSFAQGTPCQRGCTARTSPGYRTVAQPQGPLGSPKGRDVT